MILPWRDFGLPTDEQCMPEILAQSGYERRACIGKWHLGHSHVKYHPLNRGFTEFYGHYNGAIDYFTHKRMGQLDWHRNFETNYDKGYSTDLLGREAVDFINSTSQENPFLLYLAFNAPHFPLQAKKEDLRKFGYEEKEEDLPKEGYGQRGQGNNARQTYSAMVWAMDRQIGEVLNALEEKGIADNTIVLFLSDNGGKKGPGSDNSPLSGYKGTVGEGGVRVPAAIRWPGKFKPGVKCEEVTGYIDLLPTIIAAAGIEVKPQNHLDGRNMLPVLQGKESASERVLYLGHQALVTRKWKLIEGRLYDLEKDPSETNDVASKFPEVFKKLKCYLNEFQALESDENVPPLGNIEEFVVPVEWKMEGSEDSE